MTRAAAAAAVNTTLDAIVDELKRGGTVRLVGFGTFDVKKRAERSGRNPKTGKSITIPAAKLPTFRAGKSFRDTLN